MATTKKTAGKTAKRNSKPSLLSWFEESNAKWQQEGDSLLFSDAELKLITECKARCYAGEYGSFVKLYVTINLDGKTMTLKGDADSEGKRRAGIKLDIVSIKRLDLDEGEECDVDPEKCLFYDLQNVEDGKVVRRVRVLK